MKVVLSGEGADELFGGYNIYREPLALQKVAWIPEKIRRAVSRQAKKLPDRRGKSFLIRAGQRVEERFIGNAHIFTDEERRELLKNPTDTPSCQEFLRKTYEEAAGLSDPEKMQNIDLKYWLAGDILQKTDRMSMAHSLEVRVPSWTGMCSRLSGHFRRRQNLPTERRSICLGRWPGNTSRKTRPRGKSWDFRCLSVSGCGTTTGTGELKKCFKAPYPVSISTRKS